MSEPFIGEIRMWACEFAPKDWAFCNGGLLNIAENTALYSIIGTIYGGDGRTTMALPNLQNRAPMQWGRGPGLNNYIAGEPSGISTVALTPSEIPSHDHMLKGILQSGTAGVPAPNLYLGVDRPAAAENIFYLKNTTDSNTELAQQALSTSGQSQPHENRQPFLGMNFCIALEGIYPTRS